MPTSFPMSNPWTDNTLENAVALYNFITVPINDLAAAFTATGNGWMGENTSGTQTTLTTAATNITINSGVTITLTSQRRIRVISQTVFSMASGASGRFYNRIAYNTGSANTTIGTATLTPGIASITLTTTTGSGASSTFLETTFLLAAGTYTLFAAAQRGSGGSATDTAQCFNFAVYDVGSV